MDLKPKFKFFFKIDEYCDGNCENCENLLFVFPYCERDRLYNCLGLPNSTFQHAINSDCVKSEISPDNFGVE